MLLGGRLGVTSEGVGHGCTFFVEMPLIDPQKLNVSTIDDANIQQTGLIFNKHSARKVSVYSGTTIRSNAIQPESKSNRSNINNNNNINNEDEYDISDDEFERRNNNNGGSSTAFTSSDLLNPPDTHSLATNVMPFRHDTLGELGVGSQPQLMRMLSDRTSIMQLLSNRSGSFNSDDCFYTSGGIVGDQTVQQDLEGQQQYLDRRGHSNYKANKSSNGRIQMQTIPSVDTSGLTLLLVDDVSSCRKMLRRILTGRVASMDEASDGNEAVEFMQTALKEDSNAIDVILMDFVMPNMDGPEATKIIREMGYKGLVIGLTGNTSDVDVKLFLSQGADRVMGKPFELPVFMSILADLTKI